MKPSLNRRKSKRIRIPQNTRVPVHIFPVLPFLGMSIDTTLLNISAGGMALVVETTRLKGQIPKGKNLRIHFRLPGHPIWECSAKIAHNIRLNEEESYLGIRFSKMPLRLEKTINAMASANDRCDRRIEELSKPWCEPSCAFFGLCQKPLKINEEPEAPSSGFEIALQHAE